jgi:two-component system response regulator PilR (NtrC family)
VAYQHQVLVVDDEMGMREVLEIVLGNAGYIVATAASVNDAIATLEKKQFDVVLTDLYMGNDRDAGMKLLSWLEEHASGTPAIMMTAHGSVETAIEAMKRGAADYVMKPFKNDEIRLLVERAIQQRNLARENLALRIAQSRQNKLENMVGQSRPFQQVLEMVRRVATLPSTVAIHGESGAGKELIARALHELSDRREKPFVAINCGGIPETLLESELFGHKKGAFTGAVEDKEGLFVVAQGGTIFLDEIGEMPLVLQAKLLRVLDQYTVTPVGGTSEIKVNVRIISATNRDLEQMADESRFRKDLYYRLNVIPITVPPLRDRADDIPLLTRHFISRHCERMNRNRLDLSPEAEQALCNYGWPGNVRELGNVLERVVALCPGENITLQDLPPAVQQSRLAEPAKPATLSADGVDLEALVADIEIDLIKQALEAARYSQKNAARLLGLTPRSLRYRLQKYGLETD